jgi:FAD synthetase
MKVKVLACGTFDLLHPGHLSFLAQARALGDHLTVCIARDENVARFKGRFPFWSEEKRLEKLGQLPMVDHVMLGDKTDFLLPVREVAPQIVVLGYDQCFPAPMEAYMKEQGITVHRLISFLSHQFASSHLKRPLLTSSS